MKFVKRYCSILLGCIIFALGFSLFLKPAEIAPGGVSGIAILLSHFFPNIDSGIVILAINLPLLVSGAMLLGIRFLVDTIIATVFSSLCISLFSFLFPTPPTDDIFCCALIGAASLGLGLGLVFKENATTGGTDIAVRLIQRKFPHLKSGTVFLFFDSVVVSLSGIVFRDIRITTYSAISLILSMLLLNYILYGGMRAKLILVLCDDPARLSNKLSTENGVTVVYQGNGAAVSEKSLLIIAVSKRKYPYVTKTVIHSERGAKVISLPAESVDVSFLH